MNPIIIKVRRLGIATALAASLLAGACTRRVEPAAASAATPPPPPPEKSTSQTMIDGLTGKTSLEAGKHARQVVTNVNARRIADTEEAESF